MKKRKSQLVCITKIKVSGQSGFKAVIIPIKGRITDSLIDLVEAINRTPD